MDMKTFLNEVSEITRLPQLNTEHYIFMQFNSLPDENSDMPLVLVIDKSKHLPCAYWSFDEFRQTVDLNPNALDFISSYLENYLYSDANTIVDKNQAFNELDGLLQHMNRDYTVAFWRYRNYLLNHLLVEV